MSKPRVALIGLGLMGSGMARRLLRAYENALNGTGLAEHELIDPDAAGQPASGA